MQEEVDRVSESCSTAIGPEMLVGKLTVHVTILIHLSVETMESTPCVTASGLGLLVIIII